MPFTVFSAADAGLPAPETGPDGGIIGPGFPVGLAVKSFLPSHGGAIYRAKSMGEWAHGWLLSAWKPFGIVWT